MNRLLIAITCSLLIINLSAQEQPLPKKRFGDKFSFGGNFVLAFGDVTAIQISPIAGYRFTEKFTAGVGVIFDYLKYSKRVYGREIQTSTFGERLFSRYRFLPNIYATVEYQNLHMERFDNDLNRRGRVPVPIIFIGAGYLTSISEKAYVNVALLYDIVEDINSPYPNPILQWGIIVNP